MRYHPQGISARRGAGPQVWAGSATGRVEVLSAGPEEDRGPANRNRTSSFGTRPPARGPSRTGPSWGPFVWAHQDAPRWDALRRPAHDPMNLPNISLPPAFSLDPESSNFVQYGPPPRQRPPWTPVHGGRLVLRPPLTTRTRPVSSGQGGRPSSRMVPDREAAEPGASGRGQEDAFISAITSSNSRSSPSPAATARK